MAFDQRTYVDNYNKTNYKTYLLRLRNDDSINEYLQTLSNKNEYITTLIKKDRDVLTLKDIKAKIKPVLYKYAIKDLYLFGSYARGEAKANSDIDIYCDKGNIRTLIDQRKFEEELEEALDKNVDVVFTTSKMNPFFKEQMLADLIKLF